MAYAACRCSGDRTPGIIGRNSCGTSIRRCCRRSGPSRVSKPVGRAFRPAYARLKPRPTSYVVSGFRRTLMRHMRNASLIGVIAFSGLRRTRGAPDWPQWRGPEPRRHARLIRRTEGLARHADAEMEGRGRHRLRHADHRRQPRLCLLAPARQRSDARDRCRQRQDLWETSYPAPFKMNPRRRVTAPDRNRRRPFANGRLFTLGISGIVTAFDAATGKQLWQKPAPAGGAALSHGAVGARGSRTW